MKSNSKLKPPTNRLFNGFWRNVRLKEDEHFLRSANFP